MYLITYISLIRICYVAKITKLLQVNTEMCFLNVISFQEQDLEILQMFDTKNVKTN